MSGKIVIVNQKCEMLSLGFNCIITFERKCLASEVCKKRPTIYVDLKNGYQRFYFNFKPAEKELSKRLFSYFFNPKNLMDYTFPVASFCLNYYSLKIHDRGFERLPKPNYLYKELSKIVEANYHYYSLSCAILTALLFTKIGLPFPLPKVFEYIYGFDFLDDFFFPLACVFTVFEYTNDLLIKEKSLDPLYICKAFISFLLWRKSKILLKRPLERLFLAGVSRGEVWITL